MITKEDILESLKNPILGDKHRAILKLALKGLESEDLVCEQRITVNNLNNTVGILNKNRDFWRKKHNDLTDELDGKITALEEESKAKDKKLAEVTRFLNQSQSKYDSLVGQASNEIKKLQDQLKAKDADLAKAPKIINDALTVQILQAQLTESMASHHASVDDANLLIFTLLKERDALKYCLEKLKVENANTVSLQYHDELVDSANRQIISLRNERDAFQRLVGEMHTEKSCMRADLENVCNERDALAGEIKSLKESPQANQHFSHSQYAVEKMRKELGILKGEIKKWEEADRAKNADIDKLLAENQNLKDSREKLIASVIGMK